MKKLLGPHLAGLWANKMEVLRKWQPPFVLMLQPDVDKVQQLRAACPNAVIVGRFYHDDNHYASNIAARPKEFAREIHQEIVGNPVTPLLDYVQTNNEVCQDWRGIQRLNEYALESMHLADQSGAYKCAILAFSVGNPDMPHKPGDPAGFDGRMLYWQQVLPSLNYAQRNNHLLLLHAYGYPNLFAPDADWYIYRYERQVQANLGALGITSLKYAYGEIGIDRLIVKVKGGYKTVTTDQDYVNQLLQWERDQQGQSLLLGGAIFTFGDSGGWDTYDIASTNVASMIATHYADHADEYKSPQGDAQKYSSQQETYLPSISPGTVATPDSLPPRDWDARLTARGVTVETPPVAPGQKFWRVVKARWYDEKESQGRHHIYVEAPADTPFWVVGKGSETHGVTNDKTGFDAANVPMWASEGKNGYSVWINDGNPNESLEGVGMGADTPDGFNAGIHTSTGVVFQLVTMPAAATPPIEAPQPVEQPYYVSAPAGVIVRDGPGTHRTKVSTLPFGAEVKVQYIEPFDFGGTQHWARIGDSQWVAAWLLSETPPVTEPTPSAPSNEEDAFQRCLAFILRWEGGWADDPNDPGGATMRGITIGTYTRWRQNQGQPVPSKDDLRNISIIETALIYRSWYWNASKANTLAWPLCLAQMNIAVNAGPERAKQFLTESGGNFLRYNAIALEWYTKIDGWKHFSAAWARRCADVLREASK